MGLKEEKKTGSTATKEELTQITASDIEKARQEGVENKKVDDATKAVEQRFNPINHAQGESEPEVVDEAVTAGEQEPGEEIPEPDFTKNTSLTIDPMTGQVMTVGELHSRNND